MKIEIDVPQEIETYLKRLSETGRYAKSLEVTFLMLAADSIQQCVDSELVPPVTEPIVKGNAGAVYRALVDAAGRKLSFEELSEITGVKRGSMSYTLNRLRDMDLAVDYGWTGQPHWVAKGFKPIKPSERVQKPEPKIEEEIDKGTRDRDFRVMIGKYFTDRKIGVEVKGRDIFRVCGEEYSFEQLLEFANELRAEDGDPPFVKP